jgi:hypothetical protein
MVSITYPSAQWLLLDRPADWSGGKMAQSVMAILLLATLAVGCQALSVTDVLEVDMQRHPELYTDEATGRRLLQGGTFDWASLVPEGGFQQVRAAHSLRPHARPCMCCCQLVASCGNCYAVFVPLQYNSYGANQPACYHQDAPLVFKATRCKASD